MFRAYVMDVIENNPGVNWIHVSDIIKNDYSKIKSSSIVEG